MDIPAIEKTNPKGPGNRKKPKEAAVNPPGSGNHHKGINERKQDEKPDKSLRQTKSTSLTRTNEVFLRLQCKAANHGRTGSKQAMLHRLYMSATSVVREIDDIDLSLQRLEGWDNL